jgi:hypothetical protein
MHVFDLLERTLGRSSCFFPFVLVKPVLQTLLEAGKETETWHDRKKTGNGDSNDQCAPVFESFIRPMAIIEQKR